MAVEFKVTVHDKATGAAPAAQALPHGCSSAPKAVILLSAGKTTMNSQSDSYLAGIGYIGDDAGSLTEYCTAAGDQGAVTPVNCTGHVSNAAFAFVQWGETLLAQATCTSIDATNVNLSWTTNDGVAYKIIMIAIAGVEKAAAVDITCPSSAQVQDVTAPGFPPDVVLFSNTGRASSMPETSAWADLCLGAAARAGGQWTLTSRSVDGANVSRTAKGSFNGTAIAGIRANLAAGFLCTARFSGVLSNGFEINWTAVQNGVHVVGLAIKGGAWAVGMGLKEASVAGQDIYLPFVPKGLILASSPDVPRDGSPATTSSHQFCVGASDGSQSAGILVFTEYASSLSRARGMSYDDAILKTYDTLSTTPAAPTNVCDPPSMANPVALNWSTSNGSGYENYWIAVGDEDPDPSTGGGALVGPGGLAG